MYDVIAIGSATVDVFADTISQVVKFITNQGENDFIAYPLGSKILISSLSFLVGGGGTNTAVTFARQGFKTAFLGKLGNDDHSYQVLHLLEREGITFLGAKEGQTGYSIVLDSFENDRTILTFKGSNNTLLPEDVGFHQLNCRWLYASSMIEKSFETLKLLINHAKQQGTKIAFNPSNYQAKLGLEKLHDVIQQCDVLVLNLEEARLLCGKQGDAIELATLLGQDSSRYVIVTDGAKGATCYYRKQIHVVTPTPNLLVIETTGAGDAFASGFVSGLIHNLNVEDSLKMGLIQAESVIQDKGAKANLLNKQDAFEKMKSFEGEVHKLHDDGTITSPDSLFSTLRKRHNINMTDRPFYFSNGQTVASLEELGYYLKFVSQSVFDKHLHTNRNDFSTWVRDVFNNHDLADKLQNIINRFEMSRILIEEVHR